MGQRTRYEPGTFCWVDVETSDPEAAKAFYRGLLGWDYEDLRVGDGASYSIARIDGLDVAAIAPLAGAGTRPQWNCYVSVTDADASAARARELGATIVREPGDVGDSGRLAVFRDPQGAQLTLWEPGEHVGAALVNAHGALAWNDLLTSDPAAAAGFYRELFGWEIAETPGSDGRYWSVVNAGARNGGLLPSPPQAHPAWNLYFAVSDVDAAVARTGELGGSTVAGPMDVPNGGRFVVLSDPQGALFSVLSGPLDD
jgi:uncharacterized protein